MVMFSDEILCTSFFPLLLSQFPFPFFPGYGKAGGGERKAVKHALSPFLFFFAFPLLPRCSPRKEEKKW